MFDNAFSRGEEGIPINGLVWMGNHEEMLQRMEEKLEKGFHCVKLKIGAIDFDQELDLVKRIRERFSFHEIQLRLDSMPTVPSLSMRRSINSNCCRSMPSIASNSLSNKDNGR